MKRICALLLALVMMFTTVACGIPQTDDDSTPPEVTVSPAPDRDANEKETRTVSFDYNFGDKGIYLVSEVEEGEKVKEPVDPERDGYIFTGWFTAEKNGKKFNFDTAVSENIILYAGWKADGTAGRPATGGSAAGGTSSSAGTAPGGTYTPGTPADSRVYYTVTFDATGGTADTPFIKVEAGSSMNILPQATRDGHVFLGWYTDATEGTEILSSTVITGNMTVYAHWHSREIGTGDVTVTFDRNDGSGEIYQIQNLQMGDILTPPEDPTREFYGFRGWYLEQGATTEYDFSTPVNGSFVLYAGWGNPDGTDEGLYEASNTSETIFSVSDVFVENNQVTVTYNTNGVALVTVEFFEDNMGEGRWNEENLKANLRLAPVTVSSGYTASYGELATLTLPVTNELPQYFLVRVTMSDDGNSTEFVSSRYTGTYAAFDALTVDDFDPEKVINFDGDVKTNFGVIRDEVIVLPIMCQYGNGSELKVIETDKPGYDATSDEAQGENLVPDFTYVFPDKNAVISTDENGVQFTLADLKPGDIVYVEGTTYMFKIKDISEGGDGSISFTEESDVSMADFYSTLKVDFEGTNAEVSDERLRLEVLDIKDKKGSVKFGPLGIEPEVAEDIKAKANVIGSITITATAIYDAKLFGEDYIEQGLTYTVDATATIGLEYETDNKDSVNNKLKDKTLNVKFGKLSVPTPVVGLKVYVKPIMALGVKINGSFTLTYTDKVTGGYSYTTTAGRTDILDKERNLTLAATGKIIVTAGPSIDIGVELLEGVVSGGLQAGAGIRFTATAETGRGFDDALGNADSKHACGLCVSGLLEWFITVTGKVSYKVTDWFKGDILKATLFDISGPIQIGPFEEGMFFISLINAEDSPFEGHIKFGGGPCTNRTYRTEFVTVDARGNTNNGQYFYLTRLGAHNDVYDGTGGSFPYVRYLYQGVYRAEANIDNKFVLGLVTVMDAAQTVTLSPDTKETAVEGRVVDRTDYTTPIDGVTVSVYKDDIMVLASKTDAEGRFSLTAPAGAVKLSFSKDGYKDREYTIHITEGEEIHNIDDISLEKEKRTEWDSDSCGADTIWTLYDTGELEFSGTGDVTDITWDKYKSLIKRVTITDGITSMPDNAFATMPAPPGFEQDKGYPKLTFVSVAGSVKSLGEFMFWNCTSLKNITIHSNAFMPSELTAIPRDCFDGCTALETVILPDSVKEIGSQAFVNCKSLKEVSIPDGVELIDVGAYYGCTSLEKVSLPKTVKEIGQAAFAACPVITEFTISMFNPYFTVRDGVLFRQDGTLLHTYLPSGFMEYTVPDGVTTIGDHAFWGASNLKELVLPEGVTTIGFGAFADTSNLETLVLPSTLTEIGNSVFENGTALKTITFNGTRRQWDAITIGEYGNEILQNLNIIFLGNEIETSGTCGDNLTWIFDETTGILTLGGTGDMYDYNYIVEETEDDYNYYTTAPWGVYAESITSLVLSEGITSIGDFAFAYLENISGELSIPNSVTKIGQQAFYSCSSLTGSLVIPDSVTAIETMAFANCYGFANSTLTLPNNLTNITDSVFSACGFAGELKLPESTATIGLGAFAMNKFTSLELPEGLLSIDKGAFHFSSRLTGELVLPDSLTTIGAGAFSICENITSVILGENLTTFVEDEYSNALFEGCTSIKEVTFKNPAIAEITSISNPFNGMTALETVYVPADSYDAYVSAYSQYVDESVVFVAAEQPVEAISGAQADTPETEETQPMTDTPVAEDLENNATAEDTVAA